MDQFKAGDKIEHILVPGYTMTVLDTRECEQDFARPESHLAYKVTDPEGNEDWLCAYDVEKSAGGAGPRGASYSNGPLEPRSLRDLPRTETIFNLLEPRPYQRPTSTTGATGATTAAPRRSPTSTRSPNGSGRSTRTRPTAGSRATARARNRCPSRQAATPTNRPFSERTRTLTIPDINRATATDAEKLAWVKARAEAEPWNVAIASVIQDMTLMGIPLNPDLLPLFMGEAMLGGEAGVRRFIDGITLGSVAREVPNG